jgi:hypothetical protein
MPMTHVRAPHELARRHHELKAGELARHHGRRESLDANERSPARHDGPRSRGRERPKQTGWRF